MDFTLIGIEGTKWIRGDASILFTGLECSDPGQLITINKTNKTLEWALDSFLYYDAELFQEEIAKIRTHPIKRRQLLVQGLEFVPAPPENWLGMKKDQSEFVKLDGFDCKEYKIHNLVFETIRRADSTLNYSAPLSDPDSDPYLSTPLDPASYLSFEDYFNPDKISDPSEKGSGMPWPKEIISSKRKALPGSVFFSRQFPLQLQQLLPIFSALSPSSKHFELLCSVLYTLPNAGFPVSLTIPIVPTISANVTFQGFGPLPSPLLPDFFDIPSNHDGYSRIQASSPNPDYSIFRCSEFPIRPSAPYHSMDSLYL